MNENGPTRRGRRKTEEAVEFDAADAAAAADALDEEDD